MKTILQVDDQPSTLEFHGHYLEKAGFAVISAGTCEVALLLAKAHLPDLILADINLPRMNGFDLARALKADEALKQIPIIAISAHALGHHKTLAAEAGFDGYIIKPINPRTFAQQVTAFIK
jgi:DNA-binding response OmpR family regulator